MRKVKISFLAITAIGFLSLIGCSKSNNNSSSSTTTVSSSPWITLAMNYNSTDSDFEQNISAPALTSAILNDGVVLGFGAYLNQNNDTVVESGLEFDMFQTLSVGNILLQSGFDNTGLFYRYVIIPGKVMTTKGVTPMEVKSMSYAEVTKLLSPGAKSAAAPGIQ